MSDIKHENFRHDARITAKSLCRNWNLIAESRVPQNVALINARLHAPTQQHTKSQEVREVKVAELCKWTTLTALLTGEHPPSLSPSISDRRCASPSLKAMPLSSWGNRNGAISLRLALAHLCLLLSSCFQASKSSKLKKGGKKKRN